MGYAIWTQDCVYVQIAFKVLTARTPFKNCPVGTDSLTCSGNGNCLNETGICVCNLGRLYLDCSGIQCSLPNCSNNGVCDRSIGECVCEDKKWLGMNCTIPYHYIISITASTTEGGNVIVNGSFGTEHIGLSITIGGVVCSINEQDKWVLNSTNQQNKHTFKQTIQTCTIIIHIYNIKL